MENADRELILKVSRSNIMLKRLYDEHVALESTLTRFQNRKFLTPQEEVEEKKLKKKKLMGVDLMMSIVYGHSTI
ncbi:MAG: DUF465 domain-containing protein [Oligoflexia bacterium]|nr:DUF465 domain-containing protein [Oligoflexia bacterium]